MTKNDLFARSGTIVAFATAVGLVLGLRAPFDGVAVVAIVLVILALIPHGVVAFVKRPYVSGSDQGRRASSIKFCLFTLGISSMALPMTFVVGIRYAQILALLESVCAFMVAFLIVSDMAKMKA